MSETVSEAVLNKKPLVSFALIAYNQEEYIREAVDGAFSQTYTPLEIILSDDCSTDRTFEIMQEMANVYDGPHKIVLNKNSKNLHICGHINKVMSLAHGELIVVAAGDDISLPERASVIVEHYLASGQVSCSIYSDAFYITETGEQVGYYSVACPKDAFLPATYAKRKFHGVLGAAHAWHRSIFELFGPLPSKLTYEDDAIPFRAALIGQVIHISKPLVKYRRHDTSIMSKEKGLIEKKILNLNRFIFLFDSNLKDILHYSFFINKDDYSINPCFAEIVNQRLIAQLELSLLNGQTKDKISSVFKLILKCQFGVLYSSLNIFIKKYLLMEK